MHAWDPLALLEELTDSVAVYDRRGHVVYVNVAAEQLFGLARGELVGRSVWDVFPAMVGESFHAAFSRVAATGCGETFDYDYGACRGWWRNQMQSTGEGDAQRIHVVATEITLARRAEHRLRVLATASRAFAQVERDPEAILEVLARSASDALGDVIYADILSDDRSTIDTVVVHGADPDAVARVRAMRPASISIAQTMTGRVVQANRPLRLSGAALRGFECLVLAPLAVGTDVLGTVGALRMGDRGAHDDEDEHLLQELADRASLALENARVVAGQAQAVAGQQSLLRWLERIQAVTSGLSRARTPEEVAAVIVHHASEAVGALACMVWARQSDGALRLLDSRGLSSDVLERFALLRPPARLPAFSVLETGAPLWVETVEDYRAVSAEVYATMAAAGRINAFCAIPLTTHDERTHVLAFSFALGHQFSPEERDFLSTLAHQCEQAIDRASLFAAEAHARAEAELARGRAEAAVRAKDEFLAMLGHELRNPLAPIVTALDLLKLRDPALGATRELSIIDRQVTHMTSLVDDLLDVARLTRGAVTLARDPVSVKAVVTRSLEMAAPLLEQHAHAVSVDVADDLVVVGDELRLAQVFSNLLTNAAKYTAREGRIAIVATREGSDATIVIEDNGNGITPELLPTLFDLFVQGPRAADRAQGGLGLGLAIVRNLAVMHGGTVEARSDGAGKGSAFTVRLPAAVDMRAASVATAQPRPVKATPRRVLLVDDNVDAAELLAEVLRSAGHDVRVAVDGPGALRELGSFAAEIAILDLGLPVMDGYELAARIRAARAEKAPRLVALTGYGQPQDRERTRAAGFDQHFVKPVMPSMLLRALVEADRESS